MKQVSLDYFGILLGAVLIAIGLYFFWAPSALAAGGVSGLAIVIKALLPVIPIGIIILVLDMIMFALGFLMLGKSFGVKSLVCSLEISGITTLFELVVPSVKPLSDNLLILLIFGALFIALGQSIVFNLGASSGGTDIIAKIITKYFMINIGTALLVADLTVVVLAAFVFGIEKGLYAVLGVIVTTQLIDYIISGLNVQRYVMVIPSSEENIAVINDYILNTLSRGATIYQAEGGYSKARRKVITTVMERREFIEFRKAVQVLDAKAFVTVQNLHEVVGEGFKK